MSEIHFSYSSLLWALWLIPVYLYGRFFFFKKSVLSYAPLQYKTPQNKKMYFLYSEYFLESLLLACIIIGIADPHKVTERSMIK